MIPPTPLQLTLWSSALYTELAAGLWRALAAPWLQPGWPGPACTTDRHRTDKRAASAGPADARPDAVDQPPGERAEHRVIEVPPGRWQRRRDRAPTSQTEG